MNNQEVFLLPTTLNMQNSQLSCFISSISLQPFPHLAYSICHLSLLRAPTPYSTALLRIPHWLPFHSLLFSFIFQCIFLSTPLFPAASFYTCPLQPYSHPRIYFPLWAFSFAQIPSQYLPAVWRQYLRHSTVSTVPSWKTLWPCFILFLTTGKNTFPTRPLQWLHLFVFPHLYICVVFCHSRGVTKLQCPTSHGQRKILLAGAMSLMKVQLECKRKKKKKRELTSRGKIYIGLLHK